MVGSSGVEVEVADTHRQIMVWGTALAGWW